MAENKDGMKNTEEKDPNYWRSFEQLYGDPEIIAASHNEFNAAAVEEFNPNQMSALSRRKFLALLGASAALASAGCADYRDKGDIIPYNKRPEEVTLGKANYYASTSPDGSGILIKTREGRPIKVDGNPDHPVSRGKTSIHNHAEILNLYNPERLQSPLKRRKKITWETADTEIKYALSKLGGKEIAIISNRIISPTAKKTLDDFSLKYGNAKVYSYELVNESIRNSAWKKTNGGDVYPLIKWNEAKIILALEGDFLGTDGNKIENARLFSEGRNIEDADNFSRLYVVEGNMSLTGMNADYRLRLRPDAQHAFVQALLNEITGGGSGDLKSFAQKYNLSEKTLKYLADDLRSNRGKAIVYAGKTLPEDVHVAVNKLNDAMGASNLFSNASEVVLHPFSSLEEIENLVNGMNSGRVGAVIHFDSNPSYHFPNDLGYDDAVKKIPLVISMTEFENESSENAHYIFPINHAFESWGDVKIRTGFYSLQQPVISPIFNTRQKEAILQYWSEDTSERFDAGSYHKYLMKNWQDSIYPTANSGLNFSRFWTGALHDGIVLAGEGAVSQITPNYSFNSKSPAEPKGYVVSLKESYSLGDGKYANNGWLQELPHPVSKITWDNYAAISKKTAAVLDLKSNDVVEIDVDGRKINIPVFVQPGAADDTISIELGYGRRRGGTVAEGAGFDAIPLMTKNSNVSPWIFTGASVKKTGDVYNLVTAQEHHVFDNELTKDAAIKRNIIREGTIEEYQKNPGFLHEGKGHNLETFYPEYKYDGIKWGMVVDQNKCLGCGECVVACISENNIPVVGKDQVAVGREMHWIRVDRYYSGSEDEPKVHNQIMLCQHCDHAPCENVCPVVATTHSPDGLNQMVYNRCVGTRYCSNNCPYKVRRFNFFNFRDHFNNEFQENALFNLVYNPEVTVRSRGVMEKCTFCIQRIAEARAEAIRQNEPVKGSDVRTACQEACGTSAIKFGDINDPEGEIARYRKHDLAYYVLEELNVRPNVTYLAKLRNTHSEDA